MGFNIAIDYADSSSNVSKKGSTGTTDDASIATSDELDSWSRHYPRPSPGSDGGTDYPSKSASRPIAQRPIVSSQHNTDQPSHQQRAIEYPLHTQTSAINTYAQAAASNPSYMQPTATYPSNVWPATSNPYYVQPAATYPSYAQPAISYPHYVQPGGVYPAYAQAHPVYLHNAQYPSSYPLYTQSMRGYPNEVQRPSVERLPGHEGMQRRDVFNLEHSRPNRLLHFSILLRSNKKVIEDEESNFYKGEYPLLRGSGRPRHSTKEKSNVEHFDIVSTQCIPADDGVQNISLVLIDEVALRSQNNVHCESHWRHLNHDILSFEQLYKQATEIEGVEDDDLALVAQLLNKVQKTSENKFVYGKYLKPTTVVYDGQEFGGAVRSVYKTATFVSLPVFWLQHPRERESAKDSAGHPCRALLQSRYRLDTTEKRDQEQVIAKSRPNEKRIVHVPQIWALIINRNVIITCAPFDASVLRGDSIKTISYAVARGDEATWTVHFRDTDGNPFYLPLRLCRTWFVRHLLGLVKYISSVCLDDQQNRIQDELLSAGPLHKIVTEDGAIVNAETWPGMIEEERADMIHLKLVHEPVSKFLAARDTSQNPSPSPYNPGADDDDLDDQLGLQPITTAEAYHQLPALDQLRHLQTHLCNVILQAEGARAYELKGMQMPVLEALIHELTTDPLGPKWCKIAGFENITFLRDPGESRNSTPMGEIRDDVPVGGSRNEAPTGAKPGSQRSREITISSHMKHPQEKPRLKKLLKLARKEVSRALSIQKSPVVENFILPFEVPKADHLPIFLWSIRTTKPSAVDYLPQDVAAPRNPEELILHTILKEAHAKLGNMAGGLPGQREHAVLYEIAESKTVLDVNLLLYEIRRKGLNDSYQEGVREHINRDSADSVTEKGIIFDLSDKILHAFVPRECESPSVAKYWGSVFAFLAEKDVAASRNFILRLKILWPLIQDIHRGVQTTDESEQSFHIPQALPAAFQQLVMFFVFSSSTNLEVATMTSFESCKALLLQGKKQLILMTHTFDLRDRVDFKAVDPQALLALMTSNLVNKISPEGDLDLTEVYSEYALDIQHIVRDRASVQVYDKIKLLQEEIDVIKAGLVQQNSVLRDFKSTIWESHHSASLTTNVVDRVLESVEQRIEDFEELQVQADNARFLAAQSISLKAENNSKAILVFTVTTIIFLPLSFVTSYLGMNTSDLRSTSSGQSIFWTVGVPLTLIVLGSALVAAFFGSLQQRALRVMRWFKGKYD